MKEHTNYATCGSTWEWQVLYESVFMGPGKEGGGLAWQNYGQKNIVFRISYKFLQPLIWYWICLIFSIDICKYLTNLGVEYLPQEGFNLIKLSTCPKVTRDVHLWGQKHQVMTTKSNNITTTTLNVCIPCSPTIIFVWFFFCFFLIYCKSYGSWNCPKSMHKSKHTNCKS